jgi:hypothetical protein
MKDMSQSRLKCTLLAILATLVFDAFADIQHVLRLNALTDPALAIPENGVGFMQYQLTNLGKKTYHLTMQPIPGVLQEVTSDSCGEAITLAPQQSCILNLQISPEQTMGLSKIKPQVCIERNSDQCIEPQTGEHITIQELPTGKASISAKINLPQEKSKSGIDSNLGRCFSSFDTCTLTLFQGSDVTGVLEITNTSPVSIQNLMAYGLPEGVSQNASGCTLLAPGATCNLIFTAGTTKNSGTTVSIYGSNTPKSFITVQVLGVGDTYNGQQLFQLPSTSNTNFYTAAASDSSSNLDSWAFATNACINSSLPTIQQLQQLFNASNCNAGPIGGFTCSILTPTFPPYYWSSDLVGTSNFVFVIDFSTGIQTSIEDDDLGYGRCIKGYSLVYSLT